MSHFTRTPVEPMTGRPLGPTTRRPAHRPPAKSAGAPEPSPELDLRDSRDPYPADGSIAKVLEWVDRGTNKRVRSDRAKAAIAAEAGRDNPRTTLLPQLHERTG